MKKSSSSTAWTNCKALLTECAGTPFSLSLRWVGILFGSFDFGQVWNHFLACTDEKRWKSGKRKAEKVKHHLNCWQYKAILNLVFRAFLWTWQFCRILSWEEHTSQQSPSPTNPLTRSPFGNYEISSSGSQEFVEREVQIFTTFSTQFDGAVKNLAKMAADQTTK